MSVCSPRTGALAGVSREVAEKAAGDAASWADVAGGKAKRTVSAEYTALQEHVKQVGINPRWIDR